MNNNNHQMLTQYSSIDAVKKIDNESSLMDEQQIENQDSDSPYKIKSNVSRKKNFKMSKHLVDDEEDTEEEQMQDSNNNIKSCYDYSEVSNVTYYSNNNNNNNLQQNKMMPFMYNQFEQQQQQQQSIPTYYENNMNGGNSAVEFEEENSKYSNKLMSRAVDFYNCKSNILYKKI